MAKISCIGKVLAAAAASSAKAGEEKLAENR
jgi:hypothetical protein